MVIESKINLLQNNILHSKKSYDIVTFRLLQDHNLKNMILKNKNVIDDNRFVDLLDGLINLFRNLFFEIDSTEFNISAIIDSNINRMENYLLSNMDIYDNNNIKYIKEQSYKLFISNFLCNLKYVDVFKNVLIERNIEIKPLDDYSLDECIQLVELLSDLVFCMRSRSIVVYLFQNVEKDIEHYLKNNKNENYNEIYYKNKIIDHYNMQYETILESYNAKKDYLKYFKQ